MMHGHRESDSPIIPAKPSNEATPEAKEAVEERGLAKGNWLERNMLRTQSRQGSYFEFYFDSAMHVFKW